MKYDLILKNCRVADVAKMEISDTVDIAIKNGIIADIGVLACNLATRTIDCENKIASPSFIDAHVHIESSMVSPREFAKAILPHGTTTVVADPHEIVNVGGATALDEFLNMTNGAVADIFTVVPSSVPATPFDTNGAGEFLAKDMQKYVCDTRVVGLGEVMCFTEVLAGDKKILDKIALFKNKTIDGHTAGLEADKLTKYRAIGIQNDHECVTIEDAKVRIECGMNVYIREGSAVRNV
ncbi:MAG: amidohydrolase family protein [Clostridia bacterium]